MNNSKSKNFFEFNHLNSLFKWYPHIEKVVPTPKTTMIPGKIDSFDDMFAGSDAGFNLMVKQVCEAANGLGYPVFLRTDHTSNKHAWRDSCYIASETDIRSHMLNLVEFTECIMTLMFGGFVVREFLELNTVFNAFSDMPVAVEFRYFIKNDKILCRHPYWVAGAMRRVNCFDWQPKLKSMSKLYPAHQRVLDDYAQKISRAVEPLGVPENFWSIDFCQTKQGKWFVTDMAIGMDSFHYQKCKHAPVEMKKIYGDLEDTSQVTYTKEIYQKHPELKKNLGSMGDYF